MSNALINKYRPAKFSEVIGQDRVVTSLENSIEKALADAYLFIGPSGTGKTTLARLAAEAYGCKPADLNEVDAASKTGVDDMRQVMDDLMYRPLGDGAIKAVIVDECHMLSKNAIIALLKTLEDPPSWARWFLCTTDPAKVPVAIKTRCATYQLQEVRSDALVELLESTDEAEKVPEDVVRLCAKEAGGSPRQALSNLGVCLTAKNREEAAELLRTAGDAPEAFELARLLMNGGGWDEVRVMLQALKEKETNPESVRHVVRAYMTKVVLEPKNKDGGEHAFAILDAFSEPFNSGDGISPLVLACGRLVLA